MSRLFPTYAYRPAIPNWRIHFLTQLRTHDQPHLPSFGTERTHYTHYCTAQDACNSNVTVEIMPSLLLLASRCRAYLRPQPRRVGICLEDGDQRRMGVAGPGSAVRAARWGRGQVMDLQGLFTT